MTKAERRVFDYLDKLTQKRGMPPTIQEMAAAMDCCSGSVQRPLERLVRDGLVTRGPAMSSRTWRAVKPKGVPLFDMQTLGAKLRKLSA